MSVDWLEKPHDVKELYYACVSITEKNAPKFLSDKIEVKKYHPELEEYEVFGSYWTGPHSSTSFLGERLFNREIAKSDTFFLFYSPDKERCMHWMRDKYAVLFSEAKSAYEALLNAKVFDTKDINNAFPAMELGVRYSPKKEIPHFQYMENGKPANSITENNRRNEIGEWNQKLVRGELFSFEHDER